MQKILLTSIILISLFSCGHHHHGNTANTSIEAPTTKYVADKHLKKYMKVIRKEYLTLKKSKSVNITHFKNTLSSSIDGIVANCTLKEEEDQYLHLSLGRFFEGIESFENSKREEGLKKINTAFEIYDKGFK